MTVTRVPVNREHIRRGKCNSILHCPIALALIEKTGMEITVWRLRIDVGRDGTTDQYALNPEITGWIDRFDNNLPVEPFTLTLDEENRVAQREEQ